MAQHFGAYNNRPEKDRAPLLRSLFISPLAPSLPHLGSSYRVTASNGDVTAGFINPLFQPSRATVHELAKFIAS